MTAAKRKGTAWETALVRFFHDHGFPDARRVAQQGFQDLGDIHGLGPFIGQAKDYRNITDAVREGVEGAQVQRVRAGADYGVALVKRARHGTGQGYAVMTIEQFAHLMVRLREAEEEG